MVIVVLHEFRNSWGDKAHKTVELHSLFLARNNSLHVHLFDFGEG